MNDKRVFEAVGPNVQKTHTRLKSEMKSSKEAVKEFKELLSKIADESERSQVILDNPAAYEVDVLNGATLTVDSCRMKKIAAETDLKRAEEAEQIAIRRFEGFIQAYEQLISLRIDIEAEIRANQEFLLWVNKRLNAENKEIANRPKLGPLTLRMSEQIEMLSRRLSDG